MLQKVKDMWGLVERQANDSGYDLLSARESFILVRDKIYIWCYRGIVDG